MASEHGYNYQPKCNLNGECGVPPSLPPKLEQDLEQAHKQEGYNTQLLTGPWLLATTFFCAQQ